MDSSITWLGSGLTVGEGDECLLGKSKGWKNLQVDVYCHDSCPGGRIK